MCCLLWSCMCYYLHFCLVCIHLCLCMDWIIYNVNTDSQISLEPKHPPTTSLPFYCWIAQVNSCLNLQCSYEPLSNHQEIERHKATMGMKKCVYVIAMCLTLNSSISAVFWHFFNMQGGFTPFLHAVMQGHIDVADYLLENGSDVLECCGVSLLYSQQWIFYYSIVHFTYIVWC